MKTKSVEIPSLPEKSFFISITGRPNAGKTSLINSLARTKYPVGKRAGTTKGIRAIQLSKTFFIVDFPGYGRVLKRSKKFNENVKNQIIMFLEEHSEQLIIPIHVIAANSILESAKNQERKGMIPIDIEFVKFLKEITNKEPLVIINKIDKLKKSENTIQEIKSLFYGVTFIESVLKDKQGAKEIKNYLKNCFLSNEIYNEYSSLL